MHRQHLIINAFLFVLLWFYPNIGFGQYVKNVPEAFDEISSEPEVIILSNEINEPSIGGHFQGVQVLQQNGTQKIFISGSSQSKAYLLQADLTSKKTDKLITLMNEPFRHAGGFQVSEPYLAVGIEDNILKTYSKVSLYISKTLNFQKQSQN
jgi:hypothetical protein